MTIVVLARDWGNSVDGWVHSTFPHSTLHGGSLLPWIDRALHFGGVFQSILFEVSVSFLSNMCLKLVNTTGREIVAAEA